MLKPKLPITLVVITLNEEKNIKRCVESVFFVNDVVVLDSFSQDKTKEICQSLGVRFYEQAWLGYGAQKKKATELAQNDWVLSLDADEVLSVEAAEEIIKAWQELNPTAGYSFPRMSFHLGRWIRYGGWYPDRQLRLFNKKHSMWNASQVHEKVEVKTINEFKGSIQHFVFNSLSDQVRTNDKYSSIQAEQMHKAGKSFSIFLLILKPWTKFFETYFFKLGLLDGLPGFIISISAAYSVFLKWSKLWELEMSSSKDEKSWNVKN